MSAISVAQARRVTELAFMGFLFFLLGKCCFGLYGNHSSSMSVCGDISDTLVSLSLLLASVVMIGD